MAIRDSARKLAKAGLTATDSAKYPYEYFRFRAFVRQLERVRDAQSYRDLDEELRYYTRIGDVPMVASTYINMGTLLFQPGSNHRSYIPDRS